MKFDRMFLVITLALALACGGCGGKDEGSTGGTDSSKSVAAPASAPVADDLGALVPSDAALLLYVPSPEDLEKKFLHMVSLFDPEEAEDAAFVYMIKQQLGPVAEYWDTARPMALAVGMPPPGAEIDAAMGTAVLILPMSDIDKAVATFEGAPAGQAPVVKTSGSYLGMTMAPDAKPNWTGSTPAFAATAPLGDIAVRVDLDALVKHFRTDIDKGLAEMEKEMNRGAGRGVPPGQAGQMEKMFGSMVGWMGEFVDSAETLEFAIAMEGDVAEVNVGFTAKAGSKLDMVSSTGADLMALAAHLPEGFPTHVLLHMEWDKLMEWMEPLMDASVEGVPEEMRPQFKEYMAESLDMMKLLGSNFAMAFGVTDGGIQAVYVADAKDAQAYVERSKKLMASEALKSIPGMSFVQGEPTKIAGIDVTTVEMQFDLAKLMEFQGTGTIPEREKAKIEGAMKRLFGGSTMKMQFAGVENKIVFSLGDPKNLEAMIGSISEGSTALPPALTSAVDTAGGKPSFLLHADARAFLRQILTAVRDIADEDIPEVPAGDAIPVVVWGKHDGRQYGGGFSIDAGGIAEIVKAMDR